MTSHNPLESVWKQHQIMEDCLEVAWRVTKTSEVQFLRDTHFLGQSLPSTSDEIDDSRANAGEFVIIAMWAVFERLILSFLQKKGRGLLDVRPSSLADRLFAKYEGEVEYWRIDDVLDLLKGDVDSRLLGDAKNIKKHRDWIAHRNPRRPSPGSIAPGFAYRVLSEILIRIEMMDM